MNDFSPEIRNAAWWSGDSRMVANGRGFEAVSIKLGKMEREDISHLENVKMGHVMQPVIARLWEDKHQQRLKEYDVLLVVGMDLLRQYIYFEPPVPIPEHIKLVQIDEDPWQLGKNYPVEVGVIGDTKVSLAELNSLLSQHNSPELSAKIRERSARHIANHTAAREALRAKVATARDIGPLTPLGLMGALANVLPPDVAVIEEAVTTTNTTFERLGVLKNTTGYFGHRGWALGWGLGVAIGAKLAWPNRPVLALLGEGAAADPTRAAVRILGRGSGRRLHHGGRVVCYSFGG